MTAPNPNAASGANDVATIEAKFEEGVVATAMPKSEIGAIVAREGLALLKGAFPANLLLPIREAVFAWGQATASQLESEASFHRIDERPAQSKSPHTFHAYNFYFRQGAIDPAIEARLRPVFEAMKELQNAVAGTSADFTPDAEGQYLRPQVLQYPSGGGFFSEHIHPLEPQRVGLIVGLSEKSRDFRSGGTSFRVDGTVHSFEDNHDLGDVILFRYDIPHWITPIDENAPLDWTSTAGRWTMVLPYY